jgi:hypothetical protein
MKAREETRRGMKILQTLGKVVLGIVVGLAVLFGLSYLVTIGKTGDRQNLSTGSDR